MALNQYAWARTNHIDEKHSYIKIKNVTKTLKNVTKIINVCKHKKKRQ